MIRADEAGQLAGRAIALLTARDETVAAAESLTGGLVAAALTAVPGASAAFRGGVIAYATDLKASILGVPADLLSAHGAVHPRVAAAMAEGVRTRMSAAFGVATTGVAGPDPADGQPVGTVYIAVASAAGSTGAGLSLAGSRSQIRDATVQAVLVLLIRKIGEVRGEETS